MSEAIQTKIKEIEAEMDRTQKNKATEHHLGMLKAKVAKLKQQLLEEATKGKGAGGEGFEVSKSGDARIGMIGFPSVGKSTLLNKLTGTFSEVAAYEFTTLTCIPGVVKYKGAKLQLLDLPGIIEGAADGRGRGKQVIAVGKTCDLILMVLDVAKPLTDKHVLEKELEGFGIKLNQRESRVRITKKDRGGVTLRSTTNLSHLTIELVRDICLEYKMASVDVMCMGDCTVDELIDALEGNRRFIPCIYVLNKIDQITIEELDVLMKLPHCVPISARHEWNLDELVERMWQYLNLVRLYPKPRGQLPDYNEPVILRGPHCTIEDFCNRIHRQIIEQFKYALVWGTSAKHVPQRVGKEHELADEDVVQIVKK